MVDPLYKRVLVKVSGEALAGPDHFGFHAATIARIAEDIVAATRLGIELAVVVGGGNLMRGAAAAARGMDRPTADSMGMLGTVMNGLAVEQAIRDAGGTARSMSALSMPQVCEPYARQVALDHLAKGRVVVLSGGTGNPFFSTDTTAVLRGAELSCSAILKATNVDGVYTADPKKDPGATRFDHLTHAEAIARDLRIMDTAAFALARENRLPIVVFSINDERAITRVIAGEGLCTRVTV